MKSRGALTWFAVDCCIHTSQKVVQLSDDLKLDIDTVVGKITRLWAWAKTTGNENGFIGKLPDDEIAGIMRWKKKPCELISALVDNGFIDVDDGGNRWLHGWYEMNGKATEKSRNERERKSGNS